MRQRTVNEHSLALAREWKRLGRAATAVALITSPILFAVLYTSLEWPFLFALVGTFAGVVIFRGFVDVVAHKFIPSPSIYGAEKELQEQDVVSRRRLWYWRRKFRLLTWFVVLFVDLRVDRDRLSGVLGRRHVGGRRPGRGAHGGRRRTRRSRSCTCRSC